MYYKYVENLRSTGKRYFTSEEIRKDLNISKDAAKAGLYRLKKEGKIISPLSGLYVIVPPENRPYGSIPAEELVPIIMQHLKAEYYVGLLSAAAYFGAAHQKAARFQVISNKRIKHSLKFGEVIIELIYKDSLSKLPTQDFVVSTGYLKVATPELIAIDLFKYSKRAGGISHIATILSELVESINVSKLITLAENMNELCQIQRIGYIVEQIEIMDEDKKNNLITSLASYLKNIKRPYISLVPNMPKTGASRSLKWRVIENSDFESDL